jgi:hypothetical protein
MWDPEVDPLWQFEYFHQFNQGFRTLLESHLADKPEVAEQLRDEATERFLYAAQLRKGTEVQLFGVGWIDRKSGETFEDESQMLWQVGEQLTAGQQQMMKALEEPELVDSAMESFDAAIEMFGAK